MEASSVDVKYSRKLSATFCLTNLLKVKVDNTRNIYVTNPDTDSEKASKSINLDNITFQGLNSLTSDNFDPTTTQGITNIQKALVSLGLLDSQYVTGTYGSLTTQAIQKFQAQNNLPQTGNVGPMTRTKLSGG